MKSVKQSLGVHLDKNGSSLWGVSQAYSPFVLPTLATWLAVAAMLPVLTLSLELYLVPLEMTSVIRKLLLRGDE